LRALKIRNKDMDILLWVVQIVLAVVFLLHGVLFITMTPAREEQLQKRRPDAKPLPKLPRWFSIFIGVAEVLGAAGLILPGLTGILTWLTPLAAVGLMLPAIGAVTLHASRRETQQVLVTSILVLLTIFVAYIRWQVMAV
jgi:uncharacterized membrane protein YphA (DoxX/SURF4 family)